ncbi:hypothetical protein ANCDUO_24678, partial [Ancylostoma duodenale]
AQEKAVEVENMRIEHERDVAAFFDMDKQIATLQKTIKKTICMPKYLVPFLHAGRMVHVFMGFKSDSIDENHSLAQLQPIAEGAYSVKQRFSKIPLLHPVNDMRITEPAFVHAVEKVAELEQRSQEHPLRKNRDFELIKKQYLAK